MAADSAVTVGQVFYTLQINMVAGATAGTIFDGAALGAGFKGAMRNLIGSNVAVSADFAIGKLEVR